MSEAFGGIGSAARSGVPVREKTNADLRKFADRSFEVELHAPATAPATVLGMRFTSMTMFFFVERRDELLAEAQEQQQGAGEQQRPRPTITGRRLADHCAKQRPIEPASGRARASSRCSRTRAGDRDRDHAPARRSATGRRPTAAR